MREFGENTALGLPTLLHRMIHQTMVDDPLSEEKKQLIDRRRAEMKWEFLPAKGKHHYLHVTIGRKPE